MSPEQASQRLALEGWLSISHESIYLHIYADKRRGGDLCRHLRCQKPRRKRYASGQERRGTIKNRIGIDERPEIVDQKSRIGDWEGDTVIGKNHQGALVNTGREEVALHSCSPSARQTCTGRDSSGNATASPP